MAEFRKAGITLVKKHPKYSPGLNGIEKAWKFLRDTIDATEPAGREFRASLCARLRRAVAWVNRHHRQTLLKLAPKQRRRARDVLALEGVRTQW